MTWRDQKAELRTAVHTAFALPCVFQARAGGDPVTALTVRFYDKNRTGGALNAGGWAQIQEGVTRIVFNRDELTLLGVVPVQYDTVTFADYFATGDDLVVKLQVKEPHDGPVEERWTVSQG